MPVQAVLETRYRIYYLPDDSDEDAGRLIRPSTFVGWEGCTWDFDDFPSYEAATQALLDSEGHGDYIILPVMGKRLSSSR